MRRVLSILFACLMAVATVLPSGAVDREPRFVPPVDAPISDPFRPPAHPYGPGNRGIEYATTSGQRVAAAGDGVVAFAGQVGGRLFVTVDHGGDLFTTYSWLDRITTSAGTRVRRASIIGRAGEVFHFGVRFRGDYIDPELLFAGPTVRVRLVE